MFENLDSLAVILARIADLCFFATNDLIQENCRLWTCFRNAGIKAMSRGILFHAKCTARVWTSFTTVLLSMRTSTVQ